MAKVTIENIMTQLKDKMQVELELAIEAINQINNDFDLPQISEDAWFEGSMDESVNNYPQVCFYFIDELQSIVNGPAVVTSCSIEFDIIASQEHDFLDYKRILRYQYALMQAARSAWGRVGVGHDKATITALNPIDIKLFNSSFWSKVIGIRIEFNLLN